MTLLVIAVLTPLVPATALYLFARSRPISWQEWFLNFIIAGAVIEVFHVIGTWVFLSYYLRYAFLVVFLVIAVMEFGRLRRRLSESRVGVRRRIITRTAGALIAVWIAVLAYMGHMPPADTVDLSFPLAEGKYCVIQGGRNFVTNPFHNFVDSEHALDFVKINRIGNRASGIMPRDVRDYEIYGEMVYSPCDGVVYAVVDTVPDNAPPRANAIEPLGNHVMIIDNGTQIVLAHLMRRSIGVSPGDPVVRGEPIGRVGNSGYSNEPHLHLQALRLAGPDNLPQPVGITFAGRFVAINDIVTQR
jgi:hypothetical protein